MKVPFPSALRGLLVPNGPWRYVVALLAAHRLALRRRGRRSSSLVSAKQRAAAVAELKALVPPPRARLLAGERLDSDSYERFLSVVKWDPQRAAPLLEADIRWRKRFKPRGCRPQDMPRICAQSGWQVLMRPTIGFRPSPSLSRALGRSGGADGSSPSHSLPAPPPPAEAEAGTPVLDVPMPTGGEGSSSSAAQTPAERLHHIVHGVPWYTACLMLGPWFRDASADAASQLSENVRRRRRRWLGRGITRARRGMGELHPPHNKPPMMQWRYTRHGLPITLIEVKRWFPERCGRHEVEMHTAYMMEHYIRRMPTTNGQRVERVCLLMDLSGFRATTLPYVRECINVLRLHYPGRLGAACFYRVPPYFIPIWNIIKPLLDEEIMLKTHFLPGSVRDVEAAIRWCDARELPVN